jgi:hypothetical protein
MKNKGFHRAALLFLPALVFVQSCSPTEEESEPSAAENAPVVPIERVVFEAQALTLERMFAESDPEEVFANTDNTDAKETLEDLGVISVTDGVHSVETNFSAWNNEFGSTVELESALNDVLEDNEVTWCGNTTSGREFVEEYIDLYWGSFDTREQYRESFAEYVDCGTPM